MVEWKKLGEVCTLERGVRVVRKNLQESGPIPVFQNSLTPLGFFEKSNYPANIPFVICAGAAGEIGFSNGPFWAADDCTCILCKSSTISKFAYYYLLVKQHSLKSQVRKASVPRLSKNTIENLIIPIPSIAEQERIVGILDTFTTSIENLKEQIAQRRKQYACLIDECFGGNYKSMMGKAETGEIIVEPLSKHGTFTRGRRFVRTDIVDDGQPCIHYGDMYTYYGLCADKAKTHLPSDFPKKMRYAEKGDVIIVGAGENNEDIGVGLVWQGEDPAAVHDACYIYKSDLNPMFVSYFLRSGIYHLQIKSNVVRGKICSISSDGIGRALIPIYSIEKQQKIVDMLMPFESLLSNLQKQLGLRQKQYEYYRNKLLNFE